MRDTTNIVHPATVAALQQGDFFAIVVELTRWAAALAEDAKEGDDYWGVVEARLQAILDAGE